MNSSFLVVKVLQCEMCKGSILELILVSAIAGTRNSGYYWIS
jgi:hypothetical protein